MRIPNIFKFLSVLLLLALSATASAAQYKLGSGDVIRISVANRSIDIAVPADELAARPGTGYINAATGYLANFRQDVRDMSTGGVLLPPNC